MTEREKAKERNSLSLELCRLLSSESEAQTSGEKVEG